MFCLVFSLLMISISFFQENFDRLYRTPIKHDQDVLISTMLDVNRAERHRIALQERQKGREVIVTYKLRDYDKPGMPFIQVCKKTFIAVLGMHEFILYLL